MDEHWLKSMNIYIDTHNSFDLRYLSITDSNRLITAGGGHFRNFWVGMCHWDPGTLDLYQS